MISWLWEQKIRSYRESQEWTSCSVWDDRHGSYQFLSKIEGRERLIKAIIEALPTRLYWEDLRKILSPPCQTM